MEGVKGYVFASAAPLDSPPQLATSCKVRESEIRTSAELSLKAGKRHLEACSYSLSSLKTDYSSLLSSLPLNPLDPLAVRRLANQLALRP